MHEFPPEQRQRLKGVTNSTQFKFKDLFCFELKFWQKINFSKGLSKFKIFSINCKKEKLRGRNSSDSDNKYRIDDGINYSYREWAKKIVWDMSMETKELFSISSHKRFMKYVCECIIDVVFCQSSKVRRVVCLLFCWGRNFYETSLLRFWPKAKIQFKKV